jgi:hypothetical protein
METLPGGAYKDATGDGWHDANGKPLTKEQIAEAERLIAAHQAELDEVERLRVERDPDALRTLAAMLKPATPVVVAPAPASQPDATVEPVRPVQRGRQ